MIPIFNFSAIAQECISSSNTQATVFQQCNISFSNHANYPTFKIFVNIHFLQDEFGNNVDPNIAIPLAEQFIATANSELSGLQPNAKPNKQGVYSPSVIDTKYRYELYTESTNSNDLHGGIWFHSFSDKTTIEDPQFPFAYGSHGNKVINIIMYDNPTSSTIAGYSGAGSDVVMYNFQDNNCSNGSSRLMLYAKAFNHEMGHSLNLDHTTYCLNQCRNVDIDPEKECESACPSSRNCDDLNPLRDFDCNGTTVDYLCPWNKGNNFMQQGATMRALTPCQWETAYSWAINSKLPAYSWADVCLDNQPDMLITSNNVVWNFTQLLNRNVIVKTGAQLTIQCEVKMGIGKKIIVERGAKLIVQAGKITKLCANNWDGIYVHGNSSKVQPNPTTLVTQLSADDAGIVYIYQDSEISYANVAISTDAPGYAYPDQVARWGGVIYAQDSKFLNNRKNLAFMRYPITGRMDNVSYFYNCDFETTDASIDFFDLNSVTIWDTHGVDFHGNHFKNLPNRPARCAIFGIDYSANIENRNTFTDFYINYIEAEATYPYHTQLIINNNEFSGASSVTRGIKLSAGINSPKGVKVLNNDLSACKNCVYIDGSTQFDVKGNTFNQTTGTAVNALFVRNSGVFANLINCNTFKGKSSAVQLYQDNGHTLFPRNEFYNTSYAILLTAGTSSAGIPVRVNPVQCYASRNPSGALSYTNEPSSNEFFQMAKYRPMRNIVSSNVQPYQYYIPNDKVNKPHGAQYYPPDPYQNTDVYSLVEKGAPKDKVICGTLPFFTTPSFSGSIAQLRQQSASLKTQTAANPDDITLTFNSSALDLEIHDRIRREQEQLLTQANYEAAAAMLLEQPETEYRRNAFGLRVEQGEYALALNILRTLPNETQDDQWFRGIQEINMRRFMTTDYKYQLTSAEDAYLTQIANSESKERGYARALLDLLSGIRNYPEDLEDAGYRSLQEIRQDRIINNPTEHLAFISPNPVTEDFMMVSVKNVNVTRGSITLTNMLGYTALSQTFTATPFNSVDVNCGGLEAGMYIIRVMDGERTLYEGKVSLLKY